MPHNEKKNMEGFYSEYFFSFAEDAQHQDAQFDEYLDQAEDTDSCEDENNSESHPPYDRVSSDEDSVDDVASDWDEMLSHCTQGYQEEQIARSSVVRTIEQDDRISLAEYNKRKIETLCDKYELPEGAYYLFEIYGDRKNINRGLQQIDLMIAHSQFSDEEILLLFEVGMNWYQQPNRYLSWDTLAKLLEVSHGIPCWEEFMITLEIVMERQKYYRFVDTDQLIRNFSDLINTNMNF